MKGNNKLDKVLESIINLPKELEYHNRYLEEGVMDFNDELELIVKHTGQIQNICKIYDAKLENLNRNYSIIVIEKDKIKEFSSHREIEYIEKSKRLIGTKSTQRNEIASKINHKDSVIGIIDIDIDFEDIRLLNNDGTTKILKCWDQNIRDENVSKKYGFGKELNRDEINSVYLSTRNNFTYNLYRNNENNNRNFEFIVVKLKSRGEDGVSSTTEYLRALKYLIDNAKLYNKKLIIASTLKKENRNYDISLFNEIENRILEENNIKTFSEEIETESSHYRKGIIKEKEKEEIGFEVGCGERVVTLELWKSFYDDIEMEVIMPSGIKTSRIIDSKEFSKFIIEDLECYVYFKEPIKYFGEQQIFILIIPNKETVEEGLWSLKLYGNKVVDGSYDIFLSKKQMVHENTNFIQKMELNDHEISSKQVFNKELKLAKASGYRSKPKLGVKPNQRVIYTMDYNPQVMNPAFLSYIPMIYKKYK